MREGVRQSGSDGMRDGIRYKVQGTREGKD